jgi:hypothetical protein
MQIVHELAVIKKLNATHESFAPNSDDWSMIPECFLIGFTGIIEYF